MDVSDSKALLFLCECGPIIRDLVDLDSLESSFSSDPGVGAIVRHSTLCSADGREFVAAQLASHPGMRPVFAACSPREHADTLGSACEAAGVNRYLMARANVREQCAWVTPDVETATSKAAGLISAAIARVAENEPLEAPEIDCETGVLVIGAGVAGMSAALALADAGRKVTVVEREPNIGGRAVLLGELYPDMECAPCLLEPVMDRFLHHPGIDILLGSEVEEIIGYLGNFTVTVKTAPRHVDVDGCYACQTCAGVCPVSVPDPVDSGMTERKAIHIPFAGALPNASVVDESACLRFSGGDCRLCADACPFGAIDLDAGATRVERTVGGILVATGSEVQAVGDLWDSPAVITAFQMERMLNPDGPTAGEIVVTGAQAPRRVALVHCSDASGCGSATECSQTCCLSLAKTAHALAEKCPGTQVTIFAWDRVLGGPHTTASDAAASNTTVVRPDAGSQMGVQAAEGRATVTYRRNGAPLSQVFDLVVVATPQGGARGIGDLAEVLGVDLDAEGYVRVLSRKLAPFSARKEGIFVAGSAASPKDVAGAVSQGTAAAGALLSSLLEDSKLVKEAATAVVDPNRCVGCRICLLSCPFKAVSFNDEENHADINELLCHGCGTCSAVCPSSAITARHFTDRQVAAEIGALSGG